jgi:ferredoxin
MWHGMVGVYLPCLLCAGCILCVKCLAYCKTDELSVIENIQKTKLNVRRFEILNGQQIDNPYENNSQTFDDKWQLFCVR